MLSLSNGYGPLAPWKIQLRRHGKRATVIFAALFGFIALVTMLLPNKFQSQLKFLVTNERVNPLVSLNQQTTGVLYLDEISEERVNTETQLLTSTNILRKIVAEYHLADQVDHWGSSPEIRQELALKNLQKNLNVQAVRKSNIINVTYESRNPVLAASVLQTLSDLYLKAHVQLHGAPGSSKVFQQLADKYSQELVQSQNQLALFRQAHHIVALPEEKELAIQHQAEIQKQILESSATERQERQEATTLQHSLTALPKDLLIEQRAVPNQYSSERLNTLLVGLENKRAQRAELYKPNDRVIHDLDVQIQGTRSALNATNNSTSKEVSTGINPTYQSIHGELLRVGADAAGYKARNIALATALGASQARLEDLDQATAEYGNLERNVKQMEDLSSLYKNKAEEAAASEALDRQSIANVAVAEAPFVSYVPASPRRKLILALGFIWSLLITAGIIFATEHLNKHVSNHYELERVISAPLLATLPAGALPPSYSGDFSAVLSAMHQLNVQTEGRS